MKDRFFVWLFVGVFTLFSFIICAQDVSITDGKKALVCGDHYVLIINVDKSAPDGPEVEWIWDAHEAMDLPEEFRLRKFNSIDDCKMLEDRSAMMVSSSSGAVAIVRIEDLKVLFYAAVPNAHSIGMLPGNRLAAAASTHPSGNKLMIFDLDSREMIFEDSLYSAHGVVWDFKRNGLFALGYNDLRFYTDGLDGQMTLKEKWIIPGESGHDLTMTPDGDHLLLTEHTGAWKFDIDEGTFAKIPQFPDAENIKSIGLNSSGEYIYTVPEESWWTYHVSFFNPSLKLPFPDIKVYKARWY